MRGRWPLLLLVEVSCAPEIVIGLKDADAQAGSVLVFAVPGAASNCLPWPTGRANLLRSGYHGGRP